MMDKELSDFCNRNRFCLSRLSTFCNIIHFFYNTSVIISIATMITYSNWHIFKHYKTFLMLENFSCDNSFLYCSFTVFTTMIIHHRIRKGLLDLHQAHHPEIAANQAEVQSPGQRINFVSTPTCKPCQAISAVMAIARIARTNARQAQSPSERPSALLC